MNSLGSLYYARLDFIPLHSRSPQQLEGNNTSVEVVSSSQETGTSAEYENLTSKGEPAPGLSRGVVRYGRDYMNTRHVRNSWYDSGFETRGGMLTTLAAIFMTSCNASDMFLSRTISWATYHKVTRPKVVEWRVAVILIVQ